MVSIYSFFIPLNIGRAAFKVDRIKKNTIAVIHLDTTPLLEANKSGYINHEAEFLMCKEAQTHNTHVKVQPNLTLKM